MAKVLLAEDDSGIWKILNLIFQKLNVELKIVNDGGACLDALEHDQPDLLLLDNFMPVCNGIDVLEQLKQRNQLGQFDIVMLTADKDINTIKKAKEYGVSGYILKPLEFKVVAPKLFALTYEPDIQALRKQFLNMHLRDESLYNSAEFKNVDKNLHSFFPVKINDISLLVKVPVSPVPAKLYNFSESQLLETVEIYFHLKSWAKIWPQARHLKHANTSLLNAS